MLFRSALKNYEEILGQEKDSEVKITEKRIDTSLKLLDEHKDKLSASETGLRKVKLEYVRRYLVLKNAHEQNRIDKKTYEMELDKLAREYQNKVNSLTSDTSFYKEEVKKTSEVLKELQEAHRINKIFLEKEEAEKPVPVIPPKQLTKLESFMESIKKTGCFQVRNFCESPEFK